MRHCDGTDVNLVRRVAEGAYVDGAYVPCDCGMTFNDVDRSVVHPHPALIQDTAEFHRAIRAMPDDARKTVAIRALQVLEDTIAFRSDIVRRRA